MLAVSSDAPSADPDTNPQLRAEALPLLHKYTLMHASPLLRSVPGLLRRWRPPAAAAASCFEGTPSPACSFALGVTAGAHSGKWRRFARAAAKRITSEASSGSSGAPELRENRLHGVVTSPASEARKQPRLNLAVALAVTGEGE